MSRRPWFLFTGLILGLSAGLLCAWVICPARHNTTTPAALRSDFKETYRALIARAYAYDHNIERARARLALLGEPTAAEALVAQAQRALAAGHPQSEVRALGDLAAALGKAPAEASNMPPPPPTPTPPPQPTPSPQPSSNAPATPAPPSPTAAAGFPTLPPTPTPLPTRTPAPISTAGAPFRLAGLEVYCNPEAGPLLRVFVRDARNQPLPGVALTIHWLGGDEQIFTGLKPEIDPGYADFLMTPEETYQVRPAYGEAISDLRARECEGEDGERYWGGWTLTFIQP